MTALDKGKLTALDNVGGGGGRRLTALDKPRVVNVTVLGYGKGTTEH